MKYKLSDICEYAKGKVKVSALDENTYISTENMLPNKGGITTAASLPTQEQTQAFMKNDVLWNGIGSMTYALASMVLAFFVLRLGGEEQGGVFGFGYSTLGQQFFIIAYFGLRPFQITDMKGEFSFREYRQFRYITGGLALVFAFVFLF